MVYDDAWDMPQVNWVQQGSFVIPEIPPSTEPDAEPLVCLPAINQYWMPYVMGALDQLRNPSSWLVADDDAMYTTLARVTKLREMLGVRAECVSYLIRFDGETCQLQQSTDSGSTWTEVDGWAEFAACQPPQTQVQFTGGCELEESFDAGVTWEAVPGWDSNFGLCVQGAVPIIGLPPNPGDQTPDQLACSIADYLATEIILSGLQAATTAITDNLTLLEMAGGIASLIPEFVLVGAFVDGVTIIYTAVAEGTLSDFESALTNATFWSDVRCAIFDAIVVDGYVTPGNFSAILTNISAITSAPSDVVGAVHDYVQKLGATGLAQLSQVAGLNAGADCSACGGFCAKWDFRFGASGFGQTPEDATGGWVPVGCAGDGSASWYGGTVGPYVGLDIETSQLFASDVTEVEIIGLADGPNPFTPDFRAIYDPSSSAFWPFDMATGAFDVTVPINAAFPGGFRIALWANPGGVCISQIIVRTAGSAPEGNGLVSC